MCEYEFLQVAELAQFVQVCMVHDQVESDINQMDLFNLVVKLRPLEHFKSVSVNIQDLVGFNLSMAALDQ
jgi:hypothetical protein